MSSAPFPWQEPLWQQQIEQLRDGRLPQSLLIVGARGTGKAEFARQFAKTALCSAGEDRPCDVCAACRTFEAGGQADWLEIRRAEDKKEILIDQVRGFCTEIQLTANSSAGRYALIHQADRMNRAAANALLKTLEEPPNGVHVLLTAEQLSRIPATIRSRCSRILMPGARLQQSRAWLGADYAEISDAVLARLGPVEIKRQKENLAAVLGQQRQWADVLDGLKHDNDPIKAAGSIKEQEFDEFLCWWQEQLLQLMKQNIAVNGVKRLWDSLLKIRRQGQGGSINRLLALEGLFILYTELVQQASR
ncbi:MAG: hypothetical protein ACSHXK_13140 [Oceanococcus sp.]